MRIKFTKMHGLGNDFVVVDATGELKDWRPSAKEASFLQDRRFGIGADQLLILYPSTAADLRMAIYNADGSEVEMCGNGIRCCAVFARKLGLVKSDEMTVETLAGIKKPVIVPGGVRVDMGAPAYEGIAVPPPEGLNLPPMTCVSMGNPHAVFFVENVESFHLEKWGPLVERHPMFPNRTNVEFAEKVSENAIRMRVWERGAGITMACGTGSCATFVAACLNKLAAGEGKIILDGGELKIAWAGEGSSVFMTGPAAEVFSGEITL